MSTTATCLCPYTSAIILGVMSATSPTRKPVGRMRLSAEQYSVIRTQSLMDLLTSMDALISVTTAARLLGVQRGTVCKWIERKTLAAFNIDDRLYVLRSDVIERATRSR